MDSWCVYILECSDSSLYTGITNDIDARISKHLSKKGAKYTRSHPVKRLVHKENFATKAQALRREMEIKAMPRVMKLKLIKYLG